MVAATPVRHPVAVGAGLLSLSLCFQQVLLLQSLEVGKPLSVLSLAPLPAIRQDNLYYWKDRSLGLVKFSMTKLTSNLKEPRLRTRMCIYE